MNQPSEALMDQVFPNVPVRDGIEEFETLLSVKKAQDLLGYTPDHSWRAYL